MHYNIRKHCLLSKGSYVIIFCFILAASDNIDSDTTEVGKVNKKNTFANSITFYLKKGIAMFVLNYVIYINTHLNYYSQLIQSQNLIYFFFKESERAIYDDSKARVSFANLSDEIAQNIPPDKLDQIKDIIQGKQRCFNIFGIYI